MIELRAIINGKLFDPDKSEVIFHHYKNDYGVMDFMGEYVNYHDDEDIKIYLTLEKNYVIHERIFHTRAEHSYKNKNIIYAATKEEVLDLIFNYGGFEEVVKIFDINKLEKI